MNPVPYATPAPPPGKNHIICPNPNCGYRGPGKKQAKGSLGVALLLLFLLVLPGLIYMVVYSGSIIVCPQCGMKVRDA